MRDALVKQVTATLEDARVQLVTVTTEKLELLDELFAVNVDLEKRPDEISVDEGVYMTVKSLV